MINFLDYTERIKKKFNDGGFQNLTNDILEVQLSGGTLGEVLSGIVFTLNKIKKENVSAYLLVKFEIDEIIKYAKSINYI